MPTKIPPFFLGIENWIKGVFVRRAKGVFLLA